MLERFWSDRRLAVLVAIALVAAVAAVTGWLTPRGPLTPTQVLLTTVMMLAVGALTGLITGTRWSLLLAPVVLIVVFELARVGAQGATVDAIQLGSTYGVFAFVAGRVAHGLSVAIRRAWSSPRSSRWYTRRMVGLPVGHRVARRVSYREGRRLVLSRAVRH